MPTEFSYELPPYYELSWSILSTIGLLLTILIYIPIIVSAACAVANGLCYFAFYTPYSIPNRATASALADILWPIQEGGLAFHSYQILIHTLRDSTRRLFLTIFWTLMFIVALRVSILVNRVLGIVHGHAVFMIAINNLHVGYFTAIALVEPVVPLFSTTEMRFASLCLVAIARAVTYSFQVSSQAVTTVAGQLDRFVYTCECLFPLIMV
ncbi:hypothetical protein ASPWEDRAFT_51750 [Aspergillus wentii DTO 134E9]|uniref:Uncharacterized protein n=1 Tax=Aspergillus wentii DTO 134E9 TaxID=1073089 RepID=A0A1L9RLG0_ASPWE|nr:uncharacterized protein ASPWEDRAFT_51750 [Aspergillus wentii DTO 134E9]OJJ35775.1 hypothetical protein ASPWEDRAFT_51750 [Aspergillus wentii DTO 134E9]